MSVSGIFSNFTRSISGAYLWNFSRLPISWLVHILQVRLNFTYVLASEEKTNSWVQCLGSGGMAWPACWVDGQDPCRMGGESGKSVSRIKVEKDIHHQTHALWSCLPNYVTNMHGMLQEHGFRVAGKRNNTSWVTCWRECEGPKGSWKAKVGGRVGVWDTNPDCCFNNIFSIYCCINYYWLVGGLGWLFGILGVPLSNNPFHKGIPGIQTTNPNHQLTISWL